MYVYREEVGDEKPCIFTIGHSTRSIDDFVESLCSHGVKEIVDVRSIPRSLHNPQFNSDLLGNLCTSQQPTSLLIRL